MRYAQRYGARRLRAELYNESHAVGRYVLCTWLRSCGARDLNAHPQCLHTTVVDLVVDVSENLLLGQPAPTGHNQVWVGGITYLPLVGGRWCYLAT